MNKNELAKKLDELKRQIQTHEQQWILSETLIFDRDPERIRQRVNMFSKINSELKEYIDAIYVRKKRHLLNSIGPIGTLRHDQIASFLIRTSIEKGSKDSIQELERILSLTKAKSVQYTIIGGVEVNKKKRISESTSIFPIEIIKDYPEYYVFSDFWESAIQDINHRFIPVASVIAQETELSPLFIKDSKDTNLQEHFRNEAQNIVYAIALGTQKSIFRHMTFWKFKDQSLNILTGVTGYSLPLFKFLPDNFAEDTNLDWRKCSSVFQRLNKLTKVEYDDLKPALTRFLKALSIKDKKLQALELCIILEYILLSKDEKSELSYRISNRAAWLIGKNLEDRTNIKSIIKKVYNVRSTFVHGNRRDVDKIKTKLFDGSEINVDRILELGFQLTKKIIALVLRKGNLFSKIEFEKAELGARIE